MAEDTKVKNLDCKRKKTKKKVEEFLFGKKNFCKLQQATCKIK